MGNNNNKDHINEVMNNSVVSSAEIPTPEKVIEKLELKLHLAYIDADAFIGDPYALLGQVIQIRKKNGKDPVSMNDPDFPIELTPIPVPRKVNEQSKLKNPILRESIIVDQTLASNVSFLSYLKGKLDASSTFSLMMFDQAAGVIDQTDPAWAPDLRQWKIDNKDLMDDDEISYLFIIVAFTQKNIVRKKYVKYTGDLSAGAFGVNINGQLSTGTDQYSLDIKFGLTPIVLKRPKPPVTRSGPDDGEMHMPQINKSPELTEKEKRLFDSFGGIGESIEKVSS